ncbi:hypothetical protein G7Y89_g15573 [Cudoniella acicularis]|uniref:Uncharacterized protein n=1 Tax=Cudoniella acicularis TaxID=354080 RepID=A0A8H4QKQ5_9HELO|nr:hypothetical protein G7Y89_g15573 [Cudoniella acicularis]
MDSPLNTPTNLLPSLHSLDPMLYTIYEDNLVSYLTFTNTHKFGYLVQRQKGGIDEAMKNVLLTQNLALNEQQMVEGERFKGAWEQRKKKLVLYRMQRDIWFGAYGVDERYGRFDEDEESEETTEFEGSEWSARSGWTWREGEEMVMCKRKRDASEEVDEDFEPAKKAKTSHVEASQEEKCNEMHSLLQEHEDAMASNRFTAQLNDSSDDDSPPLAQNPFEDSLSLDWWMELPADFVGDWKLYAPQPLEIRKRRFSVDMQWRPETSLEMEQVNHPAENPCSDEKTVEKLWKDQWPTDWQVVTPGKKAFATFATREIEPQRIEPKKIEPKQVEPRSEFIVPELSVIPRGALYQKRQQKSKGVENSFSERAEIKDSNDNEATEKCFIEAFATLDIGGLLRDVQGPNYEFVNHDHLRYPYEQSVGLPTSLQALEPHEHSGSCSCYWCERHRSSSPLEKHDPNIRCSCNDCLAFRRKREAEERAERWMAQMRILNTETSQAEIEEVAAWQILSNST